jgi:hypothetical protein
MSITMLTALAYAINQRGAKVDAAALNKARDEGYQLGSRRTDAEHWHELYDKLYEKVRAFDEASGLQITFGWQKPDKIGSIVKLLLDGNAPFKRILDTAKYNLSKTEDLKIEIEKQIKVLEAAMVGTAEKEDEQDA